MTQVTLHLSAMKIADLSLAPKVLYCVLLEQYRESLSLGIVYRPINAQLAGWIGCDVLTISRHLTKLVEKGLITRDTVSGGANIITVRDVTEEEHTGGVNSHDWFVALPPDQLYHLHMAGKTICYNMVDGKEEVGVFIPRSEKEKESFSLEELLSFPTLDKKRPNYKTGLTEDDIIACRNSLPARERTALDNVSGVDRFGNTLIQDGENIMIRGTNSDSLIQSLGEWVTLDNVSGVSDIRASLEAYGEAVWPIPEKPNFYYRLINVTPRPETDSPF